MRYYYAVRNFHIVCHTQNSESRITTLRPHLCITAQKSPSHSGIYQLPGREQFSKPSRERGPQSVFDRNLKASPGCEIQSQSTCNPRTASALVSGCLLRTSLAPPPRKRPSTPSRGPYLRGQPERYLTAPHPTMSRSFLSSLFSSLWDSCCTYLSPAYRKLKVCPLLTF